MNPLPEGWDQQRAALPGTNVLLLIDTALQRELGQKLSQAPGTALSLLPGVEAEAQALGAWLLDESEARERGIDGVAVGVNWLASRMPLAQAHTHLQPWVIGPLPNGTPRGYLRLGDGRSLRALLNVWSPAQVSAFCAPWQAWCYADRDGKGALLDLPRAQRVQPEPDASPLLSDVQFRQLYEASVADQLLHEAKAYASPHASLASRERRHQLAVSLIEYAKSIGYEEANDHMAMLVWALRSGVEGSRRLGRQPAVEQRLRGEALWHQLVNHGERHE